MCAAALGLLVLSSLRGGDTELSFVAPAGERAGVDVGPRGASLGDTTVLSGTLEDDDGDEAGRYDGVCTITSRAADGEERRHRCAVTLTLGTDNGETELQLAAVGRTSADDVVYSVVGGSREYQGAGGEATFDYSEPDRVRIAVKLED